MLGVGDRLPVTVVMLVAVLDGLGLGLAAIGTGKGLNTGSVGGCGSGYLALAPGVIIGYFFATVLTSLLVLCVGDRLPITEVVILFYLFTTLANLLMLLA